ncbi:MAG: putative sulfate exporter family transporter, partial [Cardiobacterium hominis]
MRQKIIGMLPVLSVVILAALASREAHLARMGLSMLTLAILIGMLVGNTLYPRISAHCHEGVVFSKGQLLRLGIILYGFRLTLAQVAAVGMNSILADAIMLTTTFPSNYYVK